MTDSHILVNDSLIHKLQQQFPLKDLGSQVLSWHLSQTKYITNLLHRVRMLGAKPAPSPFPIGTQLSHLDGDSLFDPCEY
jgi:hypothetical protein